MAADSTGQFQSGGVNPAVSDTTLYTDDDGGTGSSTSTLTPNDEMTLTFNVTDNDTMDNIDYVKVIIWDDNEANEGDTNNVTNHMTFYWYEANDSWGINISAGTWALDEANSDDPGTNDTGNTSYIFKLVFTPGKISNYDGTGVWEIKTYVYDTDSNTDNDTKSSVLCNFYSEITAVDASFDFGTVDPGAQNQTATTPADGNISFSSIGNDIYDLSASATDWDDSAGHTIDLDTVDSLGMDKDSSHGDGIDLWVNNTVTVYFDNETQSSSDTTPDNRDAFPILTVPSGQFAATYTTTFTMAISQA